MFSPSLYCDNFLPCVIYSFFLRWIPVLLCFSPLFPLHVLPQCLITYVIAIICSPCPSLSSPLSCIFKPLLSPSHLSDYLIHCQASVPNVDLTFWISHVSHMCCGFWTFTSTCLDLFCHMNCLPHHLCTFFHRLLIDTINCTCSA